MSRLIPYAVRIHHETKEALPVVALQYGMTASELVRAILAMIASGHIKLTIKQEPQSGPLTTAGD